LNLLEVSEAEVAALKEQSALANTESLTRILEALTDAEIRLRDAASKKILFEVTLLKAIEARSAMSLDTVLKQLNQLRGGQGGTGAISAMPAAAAPASSAKLVTKVHHQAAAPTMLAEAAPPSGELLQLWTQLIEAVAKVSPFTRSYLVDANPVSFEKNILVIGFDPEFQDHLGLVDNARNHTLLQTKLAELGCPNCQIRFVKAERPPGYVPAVAATLTTGIPAAVVVSPAAKPAVAPATPAAKEKAPVAFNKNDFKNDPLIQRALEMFKGQIVEVRA
jgi:DNA polymerase-3 subunit gamma/tau